MIVAIYPHLFYLNLWPVVVKIGTGYPFDVHCDPMEQNWIKLNIKEILDQHPNKEVFGCHGSTKDLVQNPLLRIMV